MARAALALLAILASAVPLAAQTPADRAEDLRRRALPTDDLLIRGDLFFKSLAEWYEEAARAVLSGDRDRLGEAASRETGLLPIAWRDVLTACPDQNILVPVPFASYMAYAAGWWDGQGRGRLGTASEVANSLLQRAEDLRRIAVSVCSQPPGK